MPEVKDLSEALPETSMDPITGVGGSWHSHVTLGMGRGTTGLPAALPVPNEVNHVQAALCLPPLLTCPRRVTETHLYCDCVRRTIIATI